MTFIELSEKARQICKANYHDCGGCPIRAACIKNILPTKERYNTWIQEINDAAEVIPCNKSIKACGAEWRGADWI